MTKTVCTVAALQQMERGELELDAPVDTYRPEFADVAVLEGWERSWRRWPGRPSTWW
jgi:methyl acetate hydrolase